LDQIWGQKKVGAFRQEETLGRNEKSRRKNARNKPTCARRVKKKNKKKRKKEKENSRQLTPRMALQNWGGVRLPNHDDITPYSVKNKKKEGWVLLKGKRGICRGERHKPTKEGNSSKKVPPHSGRGEKGNQNCGLKRRKKKILGEGGNPADGGERKV